MTGLPDHFRQFAVEFEKHGYTTPFILSDDDIGVIVDARGRELAVVDANGELTNEAAENLATLVATAINACCGLCQIVTDNTNG